MEFEPPPHPIVPATKMTNKRPSIDIHRRRRDGTPSMMRPAKILPPPNPNKPKPDGCIIAVLLAAVVCMFNAAVPFPPAVIATLAGFKLHVGRLCAPAGELVKAQVSFIVPE